MNTYFLIYIITSYIIVPVLVGIYSRDISYDDDKMIEVFLIAFAPIILVLAILITPFFGLYYLGRYLSKKFGKLKTYE